MEAQKCHKCGRGDKRLFHHHKSYEPEVIVMMCWSCHQKLHARLRREKICQVPADEIQQLSNRAYHKNKRNRLDFHENLMANVELHEQIRYNYRTGNVSYSSQFLANNKKELYYVDVE